MKWNYDNDRFAPFYFVLISIKKKKKKENLEQ